MSLHDDFEKFKAMNDGWYWLSPCPCLPPPPEPSPGLHFLGRLGWHVREFFRTKSDEERLATRMARLSKI